MGASASRSKTSLHKRIHQLEEDRRFVQNALEMVLSLADFHKNINEKSGHERLLLEAVERIDKIIPLRGHAVYLVDDASAEFKPVLCSPKALCPVIKSNVENMIEEGFFAYAIRERRGVYMTSGDGRRHFLLHVIANYSRVLGMFIGLPDFGDDGRVAVPDTSLTLLSVTLLNLANVMESVSLYRLVKKQNAQLEQKVAERTCKLNQSKQELKKAMDHLKQLAHEADIANRAKSQFLANMSHEIRTPLNGIIGCTELMLRAASMDECRELARVSLGESEHLLNLVNNVLDYSKIEAGKIELEKQPFDLEALFESLAAGLKIQAETKGLTLSFHMIGKPACPVVGDALRLRQIMINLVNNAIKFTPRGAVTVTVERLAGQWDEYLQKLRISVADTGIGIPKERQAAIFQRFTQADESTTRQYGGTGLGTTIAYQLVCLMGGELTIESSPGKGSIFAFTIQLPVDQQPADKHGGGAVHRPAPDAGTQKSAAGRILVAEDTVVNQFVIREHLESHGHMVQIVGNGLEAVEACLNQRFDLVLMDVQMPEMDGFEAARRITTIVPPPVQPPIVALTANTDPRTRRACVEAGMREVLTKPIRRKALLEAVQRWVARQDSPYADMGRQGDAEDTIQKQPPLDYQTAVYEFGNPELVEKVIDQLLTSANAHLGDIRAALDQKDYTRAAQKAHAVKGSAATVEARPLASAAARLEACCKAPEDNLVEPLFEGLALCFRELERYVARSGWRPSGAPVIAKETDGSANERRQA